MGKASVKSPKRGFVIFSNLKESSSEKYYNAYIGYSGLDTEFRAI